MRVVVCAAALAIGCRRTPDIRPTDDAEVVKISIVVLEDDPSQPVIPAGAIRGLEHSGHYRLHDRWEITARLGDTIDKALPDGRRWRCTVERLMDGVTCDSSGANCVHDTIVLRWLDRSGNVTCRTGTLWYFDPRKGERPIKLVMDCDASPIPSVPARPPSGHP